jgi:glucose-6-phosphate-specific signal transduction histidine kinase
MTRRLDTRHAPRIDSLSKVADLSSSIRELRGGSVELKCELVESLAREQKRLALLLHDTLAQSLTAARIHARLAKKKLASTPEGAPVLDDLERILESSVGELQLLMRWLRAPEVDSVGFVSALTELTGLASTLVPTHFEPPRAELDTDRAIELQLVRVAQLTLFDIIRRRTAECVTVSLRSEEEDVVLCIHERGGEACSGASASILEAEVQAIGGAFDVHDEKPSGAGRGATRVVCRLPKHL